MDFGLLSTIIKAMVKISKLFLKLILFTGLYWIIICLSPIILIEEISGKPIQSGSAINIISYPFLYLGYACTILTTIQNIIRIFLKDRSFNIFKLIFTKVTGKQMKMGFIAKLNLDSINSISGFVFGKVKDKYVTKNVNEDGHVLVIGGQGSGKSTGIAIPTLISWKNPVFVVDVKLDKHEKGLTELYAKSRKARGEERIKRFNPSDETAYGYDPYYVLKDTDDITEAVTELVQAIIPLSVDVKEPFWIQSAQSLLIGSIIYFYSLDLGFSDTMIQIKSKPCMELVIEVMNSGNQEAIMHMSTFSGMDDKTLSGIFAEVSRNITPFATNKSLIRALSGEGKCISPQDLEDDYDIYICVEESKLEQWKCLMTMIINQFCKFFEKRELNKNSKSILLMLDEFPRLGRLDSILTGLTTLRSKKIYISLFVQSKSHLDVVYGDKQAVIISDNCNYKCILKASDPSTQKWCSLLVGTYDKKKTSSSFNADTMGVGKGTGMNVTTEEKAIMKPEAFNQLGEELVCVFPTGYARIKKIKSWKDKAFAHWNIVKE